jgi:hypothetical protein
MVAARGFQCSYGLALSVASIVYLRLQMRDFLIFAWARALGGARP